MTEPKVTFAMLQQRFVSGLGRRLAQLKGEFAMLTDDSSRWMATADAMMRGFHSLAGIGGTYGFPLITAIARSGEVACGNMKTSPTAEELSNLSKILDSLSAAALAATAVVNSQLDEKPAAATSDEAHSNA